MEEEERVNWSSPESGYTKEINYESIIDETQKLPFGVVPITWKDGITTYSYKGKEYTNPNEIPAFIKGTKVSRYDWIDKAGEFVGNVIQSSPTLRTVLPPIAKGLSLLESPQTESFANLVGDSAANWGLDPRLGQGLSYFVIPDATDTITPASKFVSKLDDVLVNPNYSKFNKNWAQDRMTQNLPLQIKGEVPGQIQIPGLGSAYGEKTRFWFPWELNKKNTRGKAKYGDIIDIEPRYWKKNKNNVLRKNVKFEKVEELDLSNGFIPTKDHPTFRDYIFDLIEADKIKARSINPGDLQLRAKAKGTDLELYQDYLAGYFNTYDTLEGATKVTLGTTSKGNVKYFFPSNEIPKVDRVLKIWKLNPEAFYSRYAKGANINTQAFLEDMAKSSSVDDFLAQNFKWQGHHVAIINDTFPLVKGLDMTETIKMRKLMKNAGIKLGNDPANIKFVPQQYHQGFIHNFLWKHYGPKWAGNNVNARQLQDMIAKIPTAEGRIKYINELAESLETVNDMFDIMIDNFKASKGTHWHGVKPTTEDWENFFADITLTDYQNLPPAGFPHEGGINQFGEQTFKTIDELDDEIYGSGFSPEEFE